MQGNTAAEPDDYRQRTCASHTGESVRLRAIAEGSGVIDRLVIRHLAATTDIRVGDLLVTSGLGGRFPQGYPVARVTHVDTAPGDAFAVVSAAPSSALDRGRHVLVVAQEAGTMEAVAP